MKLDHVSGRLIRIDGTKGFLRRDQYAIALAYIVDGVVQLGVLGARIYPTDWTLQNLSADAFLLQFAVKAHNSTPKPVYL